MPNLGYAVYQRPDGAICRIGWNAQGDPTDFRDPRRSYRRHPETSALKKRIEVLTFLRNQKFKILYDDILYGIDTDDFLRQEPLHTSIPLLIDVVNSANEGSCSIDGLLGVLQILPRDSDSPVLHEAKKRYDIVQRVA